MTILEMTQDILSDMSSDSVASIADTNESERVAAIIKSTYYKLLSERNFPHLGRVMTLTALADSAHPTHMLIPSNVDRVEWIRYDQIQVAGDPARFVDIQYLHPDEFIELLATRNPQDTTTVKVVADFGGVNLNIGITTPPKYWTSFDDQYVVFDSYMQSIESSMQASKSMARCYIDPQWGETVLNHAVSTAYALNDIIFVPDATGVLYFYRCTVAGTTAAILPTFTTIVGTSTVDGTATFICLGKSALDGFIPDWPSNLFPMLLSLSKAQCFNKIKQVVDSQEERDGTRQRVAAQHKTYREDGQKRIKTYGRS